MRTLLIALALVGCHQEPAPIPDDDVGIELAPWAGDKIKARCDDIAQCLVKVCEDHASDSWDCATSETCFDEEDTECQIEGSDCSPAFDEAYEIASSCFYGPGFGEAPECDPPRCRDLWKR
jgi:hypothetical protein